MSSIAPSAAAFPRDDGGVRSRSMASAAVMCRVSIRCATAPLTAAAEKDVPSHVAYPLALYRLRTPTPGASRSTHGRWGLNLATLNSSLPGTLAPAPTAMTLSSAAGHIFAWRGPWLPAAATMMTSPFVSASTVLRITIGGLLSWVAAPKEVLSTDTPASAKAAILVATSHDDPQMLYALSTWPTMRSALRALDTITPAMKVACASLSGVLTVAAGTSVPWSARYRPARSGCANSRVSRIPTLTWGLGG